VHCPRNPGTKDQRPETIHCAKDGPFKMCANSCACAQLIWGRFSRRRLRPRFSEPRAASDCLAWLKSRLRLCLLSQPVGLALWSDSDGKWRVHVLCHFAAIWCIVTNILGPAPRFNRLMVGSWVLIGFWVENRSGRVVKSSLWDVYELTKLVVAIRLWLAGIKAEKLWETTNYLYNCFIRKETLGK